MLISLILLFVFVLPTSAQDDDIKLTQDYVYTLESGERVILSYPDNWGINESDQNYPLRFSLSNNPDWLNSTIVSGEFALSILILPIDELTLVSDPEDVVDVLTAYIQQFIYEFEAEIRRVGSRDVAVGDILFESGPGFDDRFHAILFDDIVVIVQLKSLEDELDQHNDIMNAILGSIDVATQPIEVGDTDETAITLSETITIDDTQGGTLSINYPAEWFTESTASDGLLVISSSEAGLELDLSDGRLVGSGEIALGLLTMPEELMELLIEPDIELTVESALEGFSALLLEDPSLGIDIGEIALRDIGFIETAYASGNLMVDNEPLQDVQFMTLLANGGYVLLVIVADSNEMDGWQGMIDDMIRSIEYTAP